MKFPEASFVEHVDTDGRAIRLAVHQHGPADGPAVVFCHGFPELAYSWRHQLRAVGDVGFRAMAPDMRGYGASTAPEGSAAYRIDHLCGDLVALLDDRGIDRAVFVGHDWGGFVAWAMPLLHPERCAGIVGVCTPYVPFPTTEVLRPVFPDPERLYILWFQDEGVAEAVMDPLVEPIFSALLRGGRDPASSGEDLGGEAGLPDMNPFLRVAAGSFDGSALGDLVVDADELAVYVDTYRRTGFGGGIAWYRNIDANTSIVPGVGTTPLDLPCLMVCAEWDGALRPEMADGMGVVIDDLERHDVAEAGHWVQQEKPDEVNAVLVDWLERRFG